MKAKISYTCLLLILIILLAFNELGTEAESQLKLRGIGPSVGVVRLFCYPIQYNSEVVRH